MKTMSCTAQIPHAPLSVLWLAMGFALLVGQGCINLGLHRGPNFYDRVAAEPVPHAHALYMQGRELMLAGKYADAYAAFRKSANIDPTNPLPMVGLVRADLEDGKAWRAVRSVREALSRFPTDFELRLLEAVALMSNGELPAAQVILDRLKPETTANEALVARAKGDLAYRKKDMAAAKEHWERSLELEPGQAEIDRRLADIAAWNEAAQAAADRQSGEAKP